MWTPYPDRFRDLTCSLCHNVLRLDPLNKSINIPTISSRKSSYHLKHVYLSKLGEMSVAFLRKGVMSFAVPTRRILRRSLRWFSSSDPSTPTIHIPSKLISIEKNQEILNRIPLEDVRNFCFIAHVDHGKSSSLSSRLLEITGNMGTESQQFALETAKKEGLLVIHRTL